MLTNIVLELYGQIIGIDLLDEGLYFGFEGPTFAFPNQLCNLSSLQETLEALYFLKVMETLDVRFYICIFVNDGY